VLLAVQSIAVDEIERALLVTLNAMLRDGKDWEARTA
jgi:hypothetical protein